ncbi:glucose-6-phosphate 1-dehydrogenase [Alicyclobacillus hesperidum URH17-3-68]|nr:glucose-6-phosphate 1-dehydrogenase [Alicyclobacillus hesperidum URH17-3-68]
MYGVNMGQTDCDKIDRRAIVTAFFPRWTNPLLSWRFQPIYMQME